MPSKTIEISHEDLASLRRLLTYLSDHGQDPAARDCVPRAHLHRIARLSLALRARRTEFLSRAMLGEPAFDMLVGLYVADCEGDSVNVARLAELAELPPSSAIRWINYLVSRQLAQREPHPTNKRASTIALTDYGRDTLNAMFAAYAEVGVEILKG